MRCVEVATSDDRMDCRSMFYEPINPLPAKCRECGFPDLDFVPQPYFLVKSRTMSSNELAGAENGNFFVRERVLQVLELLAPGECTFYPTCYRGTMEQTPWLLAVPNRQVVQAKVDPAIPRCASCGEPRSAHPGTQWSESLFGTQIRGEGWIADSDHEILKSATWGSCESGWKAWVSREFFVSVRLLHLFKKIKAGGFHEATCHQPVKPNAEEAAWIQEKLQLLELNGIPSQAPGTISDDDAKWFRKYIKNHASDVHAWWDIKDVQRRLKTKLPKSYVDFVSKVGPVSFDNVDDEHGFRATILHPGEVAVEVGYEDGFEDEDSKAVNALMFATTDHGDCFCFDVQKGTKEFPVVLYKHEGNFFERYTDNFAACIRRFAGNCAERP